MPPEQLRESLELLRASATARPIGVDRKANVLRGYVVAQLGPFKSLGRGEFDQESLDAIVKLGNELKQGLKSRFSHPTECDDGLGKHLGRTRDLFMSDAVNADGVKVPAVRGDLYFDQTALDQPPAGGKPLGIYVMDLAESDPDALSSSLVLRVRREIRLNPDGTRRKDDKGEELPPLWRPEKLRASDIVDTGDAVDGLLSEGMTDGLPNAILWQATEMLDGMFDGQDRDEVDQRIDSFKARYLALRFGPKQVPVIIPVASPPTVPAAEQPPLEPLQPSLSTLLLRQRQRELESLT
jgi:hypothetical protein